MAKSARSSSKKSNNQRLKKHVFGPVEAARLERLSAKLLEVAAQPKPPRDAEMKLVDVPRAGEEGADSPTQAVTSKMDVDLENTTSNSRSTQANSRGTKKVQKRKRTSKIVFPKYKDRKTKRRK